MEGLLSDIAELYETVTVTRALVLALDDDEAAAFYRHLTELDHTVILINSSDIEDDRPKYMEKLVQFNTCQNRVLIMTFAAWISLKKETELYAMDHNILAVGDLESQQLRIFMSWVLDAREHGFCNKQGSYHTLFFDQYVSE
jgi:hypothetical protein